MKTTKPISTISYNTEIFLNARLNELLKADKLQFWAYINHLAEDDDRKEHFHVYMEPAVALDTLALKKQFLEIDLGHDEPRKCLNIVKSNFRDWYWYCLHDKVYLLLKGLTREKSYRMEDMVTSDQDEFNEKVRNSPRGNEKSKILSDVLKQYSKEGKDFADVLSDGLIPLKAIPSNSCIINSVQRN